MLFFGAPFWAAPAPPRRRLAFAPTGIEESNTAFAAVNLNVRSGSRPPARSSVSSYTAFVAEPSLHSGQKNLARISLVTSSTATAPAEPHLVCRQGARNLLGFGPLSILFFVPPLHSHFCSFSQHIRRRSPFFQPTCHPTQPRPPSKIRPGYPPCPAKSPNVPLPTLHTPAPSISFSASQVVDTRLVHAALLRSTHLISPARNPACSAGP